MKNISDRTKFILLMESLNVDVERFKYLQYKKNKLNPKLYKCITGTYAELVAEEANAGEPTDRDYLEINPMFYQREWSDKIKYIEDIRFTHSDIKDGMVPYSFEKLFNNKRVPKAVKEDIMFDVFKVWIEEYRETIDKRIIIYGSVIDSIQHRKIKQKTIRLRDFALIYLIFNILLMINKPEAVTTMAGLQGIGYNLNDAMQKSTWINILGLATGYGFVLYFIAKLFLGLLFRDFLHTFTDKKATKERLEKHINDKVIEQTGDVESYIDNFNEQTELKKTDIYDLCTLQKAMEDYEYYFDRTSNRFSFAASRKIVFENYFTIFFFILLGLFIFLVLIGLGMDVSL